MLTRVFHQVRQECFWLQTQIDCVTLVSLVAVVPGRPDVPALCFPDGSQGAGEAAAGPQSQPQLHHHSRPHSPSHRRP